MSLKKLTDRVRAELSAREKEAREKHAREQHLAELWDTHCAQNANAAQCLQPWILHTHSRLYGSQGSYAFRDATPEQCAELLASFPPVSAVIHRDTRGYIGYRPRSAAESDAKECSEVPGGASMRIDRTGDQWTAVKVEWYAELSGALVELDVTLANLRDITPSLTGRIEYADPQHKYIRRISDVRPVFPVQPIDPLRHIRYSAGAPEQWPMILVHGNVRAYVEQLAAHCLEKRQHSRKAYELDKVEGLPPVPEAAPYDRSGSLRAGTREQYDCLNSEPARKDRALAEKHWKAYAEEHGLDAGRCGFDYFSWACAYLKRNGLYEVPDPRDPSKQYKYGHAWL